MTDKSTAAHYRRLAIAFDSTVEGLNADDWEKQSPCEQWSAREVLEHVLDSEVDVATKVGLSIDRSVDPTHDPLGAWREVRDAMQAILDDPAKSGLTYESFGNPTTLAKTVSRFLFFDLIVHRWDIARAAGEDVRIAPEDVDSGHDFLDAMGQMFYDYGASAPALPIPDDASPQDKLLGRAGREPQWTAP